MTEQTAPDAGAVTVVGPAETAPVDGSDYWDALIDEKEGAIFLDVTPRTMQQKRQRGDGPPYILLSPRCVRYTRRLLKGYADKRLRTSTADPGPEDTQ